MIRFDGSLLAVEVYNGCSVWRTSLFLMGLDYHGTIHDIDVMASFPVFMMKMCKLILKQSILFFRKNQLFMLRTRITEPIYHLISYVEHPINAFASSCWPVLTAASAVLMCLISENADDWLDYWFVLCRNIVFPFSLKC